MQATAIISLIVNFTLLIVAFCMAPPCASARTAVAILAMGQTSTARGASDRLSSNFSRVPTLKLVDSDLSASAAKGIGYEGSLNMTLDEARNLGAAIDCDFFITGDAQTIRRSAFDRRVYYESYASIFMVSARTGRLVLWDRPVSQTAEPGLSETALLAEIDRRAARYQAAILEAAETERRELETGYGSEASRIYEEAPDDEKAAAALGLRLPQPYRRLQPSYPQSAAAADAEGVVDLMININPDGEIAKIEVARWAGFGLDDAAVETVQQLHFRPAMRNGNPIPMRVMLRYNFRRPPKNNM
jgi:TonB family protein